MKSQFSFLMQRSALNLLSCCLTLAAFDMQLAAQENVRELESETVDVIDKTLINDVADQASQSNAAAATDMRELYEKFRKLLTGAKLRGQFTVDGKPLNNLSEESYEIQKVEKLPVGDEWIVTARIKYGQRDMTFPVPLEVKWAGSTPVMTLDNMTIPGFGTFGARVVFHKDKYAGTWQHDDVGGHMFGVVEFDNAEKASPAGAKAPADPSK